MDERTRLSSFRIARASDADAIAQLHADSWRRTYRGAYSDAYLDGDVFADRTRVWRERLGSPKPNQFVCLAERSGTLAGFVCAFGAEDPTWGSLIDNMHVDVRWRQLGIGSALMRRAGTWLAGSYPD